MHEIRTLPAVETRVETGPIRFGEDWPGIFIRGDNAFALRLELEQAEKLIEDGLAKSFLRSVILLLDECNLNPSTKLGDKVSERNGNPD